MYYVYIIESITTGRWYYGFTERPEARLIEHNSSNNHFTGGKGPWAFIFRRAFGDKTEALEFENLLKKNRNKRYLRQTYPQYFV